MLKYIITSFWILFLFTIQGNSQFYTSAQIVNIDTNKLGHEGDLYLDTINEDYFIGLTTGRLSKLGMDSARVSSIFYDLLDTINGSVFPIFAERSSALVTSAFEYAFGNGDLSQAGFGIILPMNCELFAVGMTCRTGSAEIEVYKNGVATGLRSGTASPNAINTSISPLQFKAGDVINFQTVLATGASDGGKPVAWFRIPSKNTPSLRLYGGAIPSNTLGDNDDEYLDTSTGDLYAKTGGVWVFQTNLKGITGASSLRSYIQVTNLVTTDINSATTTYNWINTTSSTFVTNDAPNFTVVSDGITVNKTATYKITVYQYQISGGSQRTNATIKLTKNGIQQDGFGANAYIRFISGHNESTASFSKLISVAVGEKIGFVNIQQGIVGAVTCPANSLIFMIEEM